MMIREDLRTELMVRVAEVAWNLIEDGIPEDTAISDAMGDSYRIPLWALEGWTVEVFGLCPNALLPDRNDRWLFESDVWAFIKGDWHDVGGMVPKN